MYVFMAKLAYKTFGNFQIYGLINHLRRSRLARTLSVETVEDIENTCVTKKYLTHPNTHPTNTLISINYSPTFGYRKNVIYREETTLNILHWTWVKILTYRIV